MVDGPSYISAHSIHTHTERSDRRMDMEYIIHKGGRNGIRPWRRGWAIWNRWANGEEPASTINNPMVWG